MTTTEKIPYRWITYDVWGNSEDGYEVNAAYSTYSVWRFDKDVTDETVIKAVFEEDADQVEIDPHCDEYGFVFLAKEDGKPLGELRRIEE